jgi:hypothetical protein
LQRRHCGAVAHTAAHFRYQPYALPRRPAGSGECRVAIQHVNGFENLSPQMLDEIEAFFMQYARSSDKELEVLGRSTQRRAQKLVRAGQV